MHAPGIQWRPYGDNVYTPSNRGNLRRDALYDILKDLPGVQLSCPEGAFYMFPNFSERIPADLTGTDRSRHIYDKLMGQGVASVYGSCFGKHFGDNVRLSFSATPVAAIDEAAGRLHSIFD